MILLALIFLLFPAQVRAAVGQSMPAGILSFNNSAAGGGGGGGGSPDISIVDNTTGKQSASATTLVFTPAVTVTAGQTIIVAVIAGGQSIDSVIGSDLNAFTQAANYQNTQGTAAIYYLTAAGTLTSGVYQITVTAGGAASLTGSCIVVSGLNALDKTASTSGTSATAGTGTTATTSANCGLWVGAFVDSSGANDAITPQGSAVEIFEEQNGSSFAAGAGAYNITSTNNTGASIAWTLAQSYTWDGAIATFE